MKKLITLLMIFTLSTPLFACSNSNEQDPTPSPSDSQNETESSTVEVDKGLMDVTITLPASMFEGDDSSTFDVEAYTKENGFKETIVNADGSIAVTMSKNKHNELLKEMRVSVEESFSSLIEAVDTPYIKDIKSTDGYKKITMSVDKVGYESTIFDLTPFLLAMNAGMYQMFEGTTPYSEIIILDAVSQETINTIIYPDDFNTEE